MSSELPRSAADLPDADEDIERLDEEQRRRCATFWALRAQAEQRAGTAVVVVVEDLRALGAPEALISVADRSVIQEAMHADVCRRVAATYDRRTAAAVRDLPPAPDDHEVGPAWRVRHVVGFLCISETFAAAYLAGARAAATSTLARAALHIMLADEVGHGQLGWAFLASPAAPAARLLEQMLVPLLGAYEGYIRTRTAAYPDIDLAAHGCPSARLLPGQYLDAVEELILPGFERFGVGIDDARRWLREARGRAVG